jgi:hypothetical protein
MMQATEDCSNFDSPGIFAKNTLFEAVLDFFNVMLKRKQSKKAI